MGRFELDFDFVWQLKLQMLQSGNLKKEIIARRKKNVNCYEKIIVVVIYTRQACTSRTCNEICCVGHYRTKTLATPTHNNSHTIIRKHICTKLIVASAHKNDKNEKLRPYCSRAPTTIQHTHTPTYKFFQYPSQDLSWFWP